MESEDILVVVGTNPSPKDQTQMFRGYTAILYAYWYSVHIWGCDPLDYTNPMLHVNLQNKHINTHPI